MSSPVAAIRKSTRTKRAATSIYEDAKKEISERESLAPRERPNSRKKSKDDESVSEPEVTDDEEEEHLEEDPEESTDDDDSSVEEEIKPSPKSVTNKKKRAAPKKIAVKVGNSNNNKKSKGKSPSTKRGTAPANTKKALTNALNALAKKVLEEEETPANSLVAALLTSHMTTADAAAGGPKDSDTPYTAGLQQAARRIVELHKSDTNKAQIDLMNLLFRSVGGSLETVLDADALMLEEMDSEQWGQVITDLVDDMRYTQVDHLLLCADPKGAVHAAAVDKDESAQVKVTPSIMAVMEYRKIYEEFWYVLGTVALTEGYSAGGDDDDKTTSRFQTEMAENIILRVNELVTVGQPDVRAAATIAAMQMGLAVLNRTVEIGRKLDVATRQFHASKESASSKKAEALGHQVESLKRTKEDLEALVLGPIFQVVFMHRYRDSNANIRAFAMNALSRMTLMRPDIFLSDKYLKYFGWMLSDKSAVVRCAALSGLIAPFQAIETRQRNSSQIVLSQMENVIYKFMNCIGDRAVDGNVQVQEKALALFVYLSRHSFMETVEDENLWTQVNLRALATDTSPAGRRDALYFVIDQLEAFDNDDDEEEDVSQQSNGSKRWSKDKGASLVQSDEKMIVQRLESLAAWVAHTLTDGPIPIDQIRVERADYIVESLRAMPEHKCLVTNWSAMLRAIGDDKTDTLSQNRSEVAKQRVLVQMLACAAQAEVGVVADDVFLHKDIDSDVVELKMSSPVLAEQPAKKKKRGAQGGSGGIAHEVLSVALLQALPNLLVRFKTDPAILRSVTILPRYLLPSVVSLPQRKNDFLSLIKKLVEIFTESSDTQILANIAHSLTFLAGGDHVRARDARLQLQRLTSNLSERLMGLLDQSVALGEDDGSSKKPAARKQSEKRGKRKRSGGKSSQSSRSSASSLESDNEEEEEQGSSELRDVEHAIYLGLKRISVLSRRLNVAENLEASTKNAKAIDTLCNKIVEGVASRLKDRQVVSAKTQEENDEQSSAGSIPEIWQKDEYKQVHGIVALSVREALDFLLANTAWSRHETLDQDKMKDDDDIEEDVVTKQRDQLVALLCLCFEQFLPAADREEMREKYSKEHIMFADAVQASASQVAADVRSSFRREYLEATAPHLRAFAFTEDQQLAAGFVRYFRSKEEELRTLEEGEEEDKSDLVQQMFLPFTRSLVVNWKDGNRREAGYALAHITGSGAEAAKVVSAMARKVKQLDPVRLLETQMACLRTSFEDWLNNEPEEPESDRPSEEEMEAFAEAEEMYQKKFELIEQQATRLSASLGVAQFKGSGKKLAKPLLGFVREGVRYAFSTDIPGEEPLMPGGRLTFLLLLSKYAAWIKKNKEQKAAVFEDLDAREDLLKEDPDYGDVHVDDLAALKAFREALGEPKGKKASLSPRSIANSPGEDSMDHEDDGSLDRTPASSRAVGGRMSRGSSVGSVRSRMSTTHSSLSPLYEEDDDISPSPAKRRKTRPSFGSNTSVSTLGKTQATIDEASDESDGSDTVMSA